MDNRWKDFISNNKEAFDEYDAPENLWGQIADGLDKKETTFSEPKVKRLKAYNFLKIASIFLITCGLFIGVYFYGKHKGYEDYSKINPELAELKDNFIQSINRKKDSLNHFIHHDPQLESEFLPPLVDMEKNYEELKKKLSESPDKERILKAMIMNLEVQSEILNQQLMIVSQFKTQPNESL